jgi:hypothetical protein
MPPAPSTAAAAVALLTAAYGAHSQATHDAVLDSANPYDLAVFLATLHAGALTAMPDGATRLRAYGLAAAETER